MQLIPEWRSAWKFLTVQVAALAVAWAAIPADMQESFLGLIGISQDKVPAVLGGLVIVARLIAQPKIHSST